MPLICPAILASDEAQYKAQIEKIVHLAKRIQIDLTDGLFASSQTVAADNAWWPVGFAADIHLMFRNPLPAVQKIVVHKPNLVIVHAEAQGDFASVLDLCRKHDVGVGIALLPETPADNIYSVLEYIDHVLIFSGKLGEFGGSANLELLDKVGQLKNRKPDIEIGWDGGVDDQNVASLVSGGVDVLDVGGFIQSSDDPTRAFHALQRIADETGTT